jgi:hypothetical protein
MSHSTSRPTRSQAKPVRARRQHEIKIRFNDNELSTVKSRAADRNRYLSEYIRMASLGQAEPSSEKSETA